MSWTYRASEPATRVNFSSAMMLKVNRATKPRPGAMKVLHSRGSRLRRKWTTTASAAMACTIMTARVPKPSPTGTSVSTGGSGLPSASGWTTTAKTAATRIAKARFTSSARWGAPLRLVCASQAGSTRARPRA